MSVSLVTVYHGYRGLAWDRAGVCLTGLGELVIVYYIARDIGGKRVSV